MRDEFVRYYNDELGYLRSMGQEFAREHPGIARGLLLLESDARDPHVERILDAFAFLSARIRLKIDDEFPEIIEALLTVLYPHYVRPLPSMAIAQMHIDPERGKLTSGYKVARGTPLFSAPVKGQECKFQTCYDTTLWPLEVKEAGYRGPGGLDLKGTDAYGVFRLVIECAPEVALDKLELDSLRFFLQNNQPEVAHTVYELLLNNCTQILVRDPDRHRHPAHVLSPSSLRPAGFGEDEGLLPYPRRSFLAYRLLQEYFAFPDKYMFVDLSGLRPVWASGYKRRAEILFLISQYEREERRESLEVRLDKDTFRLGCTPIINLFAKDCEPIALDQRKYEYPIVADLRRRATTGIYSVEQVSGINRAANTSVVYEPFYAYRHASIRDNSQQFWVVNRRQAEAQDDSPNLTLSIVDLSRRPIDPTEDSITVRALCTNRDLPSLLPPGDFHMEGSSAVQRIHCGKPTKPLYPPAGQATFWRLLSHLSLNYLSIVEDGREALQEILRLYNFSREPHLENQIQAIAALQSSRQFARVISEHGISFTRGMRVEIKFDEEKFAGTGVFLFAQVLERFLGLYVSINSYSQLVARTGQRKGVLREWPPRAGHRILI